MGLAGTVGGRARRAEIERAAAEVLSEDGYAAASVGRIAQRAGVSKGVVSYHFSSKDELLCGVALSLFGDCAAAVAAAAAEASSPAAQLRATISAELEYFSSRRVEFRAMSEVMANHRDPAFAEAFEDVAAEEADTVAGLLRRGQATGQFRSCDADEAARLIDAAKYDVLDRWASDTSLDLGSMTVALLDFIEHAMRA